MDSCALLISKLAGTEILFLPCGLADMNGNRSDFDEEAKSYLINLRKSLQRIDYFLHLFSWAILSVTLSLFYKFNLVVVARANHISVEKCFLCF